MIQYDGLKGPNIMTEFSRLFILCSVIDGNFIINYTDSNRAER